MKRKITEWEKIFANRISAKGLVSRIYKEFSKVNNKETTNLFFYEQNICTDFTKDTQMANKHMIRYLTSFVITKCKLKSQ